MGLKKDTDEALRELLEDIKTDIERFLRNTQDENDWTNRTDWGMG